MIVVHAGKAHTDDFLASCVCAYKTNLPVFRQSFTPEMLLDKDVWVLDQGLTYDPELHNFDHHQINAAVCSFTQILDYFYPTIDFRAFLRYIKTVEMFDTFGPKGAAKYIGITENQLSLTLNPIVPAILGVFSTINGEVPQDMLNIMKAVGFDICHQIESRGVLFSVLDKNAKVITCADIRVLDVVDCEMPEGFSFGDLPTKEWCRETDNHDVCVVLTKDSRNDGMYRMISTNTDMVKFKPHPKSEFCHNSGFLISFANLSDYMDILIESIKA